MSRRIGPSGSTFPQASYGSGAPWVKGRRFHATGEYRAPVAGEWFLSGAKPEAYFTQSGLASIYYIAEPVTPGLCPTCGQEVKG